MIKLKRIYKEPAKSDGYRVLVDRLWPRGISKEEAGIDAWMKDVAPSDDLRKRFHSGKSNWDEFRREYLSELKEYRDELRPLADKAKRERVTLVYSANDEEHNNAVVLKQYLQMF